MIEEMTEEYDGQKCLISVDNILDTVLDKIEKNNRN